MAMHVNTKQARRKIKIDNQKLAIRWVHSHRMFQIMNLDRILNLLASIDHYQHAPPKSHKIKFYFCMPDRVVPLVSVSIVSK